MERWLAGIAQADGPLGLLADSGAKATILLLAAWLAARSLRKSSAAARHWAWGLALGGLIALPMISRLGPGWQLPAPAPPAPAEVASTAPASLPSPALPIEPRPAMIPSEIPRVEIGPEADANAAIRPASPAPEAGHLRADGGRPDEAATAAPSPRRAAAEWLLAAWAIGALVALLPLVVGIVANERHRHRATPVRDEGWVALLDSLRSRLAIGRRVELRLGGAGQIPMTWGIARPVILLPEGAPAWPEETRRAVLLHELAHIARLDAGSQIVGRLAASLFWFHPLAWYALHRLRAECEHACDDLVIGSGERPTDYARQLLELARSLRAPRLPIAVAMARPNALEGRIVQLLDETRSRGPFGRRARRRLAAGAALLVLAVSTAHPGAPAAGREEPNNGPAARAVPGEAEQGASGRITGRVIRAEGGQPAPGAEVILLPPPPKGKDVYIGKLPLRRAAADASGAFSFDGLAPGRYRVWANQDRLSSRQQRNRGEAVIIREAGGPAGPVELKLAPAPSVTFRIGDKATGKPIAGATVHPTWSDFPDDFPTSPDGLARVGPLTPERWRFEAWASGFALQSRWLDLTAGEDADAEFLLEPGGDLEGVVRDQAGKPLEEIGISAFVEGINEQFQYVESGSGGKYKLPNLPLGRALRIVLYRKGVDHQEFPVRLAEPNQTLDFSMRGQPHGGSIVGIVVDREGRPIVGAKLVNMGRSTDETRKGTTGSNGRFHLEDLYEGTSGKQVLVRAPGFSPKRVKVEAGPADEPAEVKIMLEPGIASRGEWSMTRGNPWEGSWSTTRMGGARSPTASGSPPMTADLSHSTRSRRTRLSASTERDSPGSAIGNSRSTAMRK